MTTPNLAIVVTFGATGTPSPAAPTFIRKTDAIIPAGALTSTVILATPTIAGHQLILEAALAVPNSSVFINSVTDSLGNTWGNPIYEESGTVDLELWVVPASGPPGALGSITSVTLHFNHNTHEGGVVRISEYNNVDTTAPSTNGQIGASTAPDSLSASTTGDFLVVAAIGARGKTTSVSAQTGGFTLQTPDLTGP